MEEYLKCLESCFRKIEIDEKIFCHCFTLKNDEEFIKKKVWQDDDEQEESRCPLHKETENMQRQEDKLESCHFIQILPKSIHIQKSDINENAYGAWSIMKIPKGVRFGPYESIVISDEDEADQSDYPWQVLQEDDICCFIDVKDANESSNWLHYVNFASFQEQQNLIALLHHGQIYYETIRDILPNTELFVWCRNERTVVIGSEDNNTGEKLDDVDENRCMQKVINVQGHQHIQKRKNLYVCDVCEKIFEQKIQLEQHRHIHIREKPYICQLCEKSFEWKFALTQHKRAHAGEKPYACETCGRKFMQRSHLEQHKHIHTGEKPHICEMCGKRFLRKSTLEQHKYIHTGEKPYICEACGKSFVQKSNLERHKYIHIEEKPYVCEMCEKKFVHKSYLEQHKHIHRGEKPYACDMCDKRFVRKYSLKQHKDIHLAERSYDTHISEDLCGIIAFDNVDVHTENKCLILMM